MDTILTVSQDKKDFPIQDILKRLGYIVVASLLLFLPFQNPVGKLIKSPVLFFWIDEMFVALVFVLFLNIILFEGKIRKGPLKVLICLILLGVIGMISGSMNGNSLIVTVNGIFDYIKNFLMIPTVFVFSLSGKRGGKIFIVLHRLAIALCLIAILQEIAFFIGVPVHQVGVFHYELRFGLMRASSLMGHPNIFGLYALLFFTLDFSLHRRIRLQNVLFASGIFLSISRMVWIGFLISFFFLFIQEKGKKFKILFLLTTTLIAFAIPYFYYITAREIDQSSYFRGYALSKSLEIFKDHPIWGVGPGMYGGVVSFTFNSPIYQTYSFDKNWFDFIKEFRSIDQFWPQILAEMGVSGTFFFGVLLFYLWKVPQKISEISENEFRKKMLSGLSVMPIVLVVYLFGSGLNLAPFLLTYGTLLGLILGMKDEGPACQ
jgi:hypothetical protein